MAPWNCEAEATCSGSVVAVAGVWNVVGQWVIRRLLEKGYRVRSALCTRPDEAAELMALKGAEENLQLTAADLLDYGDLTRAFQGCCAVFLTTPSADSLNGLKDYPADMVESEVRSTLNVVEACANTISVKRLILTSCASTIVFDSHNINVGKVVDERCWSNLDFCRENKLWGAVCKTSAERAAWALARDRGLDLVVINPATVVGPLSANTTPNSMISHLKEGKQSAIMAYAHVDEVADAHIRAMENQDAAGRFLVFHRLLSSKESNELQRSYTNSARVLESWRCVPLSNQKFQRLETSV
ncbi:unnamed protein product [Calypogeia fissa]